MMSREIHSIVVLLMIVAVLTQTSQAAKAAREKAQIPQLLIRAPAPTAPTAVIVSNQLRVQVEAPSGGAAGGAEVELSAVSPTFGSAATWRVALPQLIAGALVPAQVVGNRTGRWQLRARLIEPRVGPWSAPVLVELTSPLAAPGPARPATDSMRPAPGR
jgi:hypothetical protein